MASSKRQKPLKVTKVAGNAAINRRPLLKAIRSLNRSEKAGKKVRRWASGGK